MVLHLLSVVVLSILHTCTGTFYHGGSPLIPFHTEVSVMYPGHLGPMMPYPVRRVIRIKRPRGYIHQIHFRGVHTHRKPAPGWMFPQGTVYPDTGIQWPLPDDWKDTNTWAVVNPDSIITSEVLTPDNSINDKVNPDNIPDNIFPGVDTLPTRGDIIPVIFPTSDKEKDPNVVRPLEPATTGVIGVATMAPNNGSKDNVSATKSPDQDLDIQFLIPTPVTPGSSNTSTSSLGEKNSTDDGNSSSTLSDAINSTTTNGDSTGEDCHKTGCSNGSECVYADTWICPNYIPDVPCKCKPGCRVENTFIPSGSIVTMDTCGNTCSCQNIYGKAACTNKSCNKKELGASDTSILSTTTSNPKATGDKKVSTVDDKQVTGSTDNDIVMTFPKIPSVPVSLGKN